METKALKKQLGAAIVMVIVAAIALGAATFAWFVNNTKVTADGANVTAKAANTLLISEVDQNDWKTSLPLSADLKDLVPVSTSGSEGKELSFVKDNKWSNDSKYASEFAAATAGTEYYAKDFQLKSSVAGSTLYLDDETTFKMAENANSDALKSMRLGLVIGDKTFIYQVDDGTLKSRYSTSIGSDSGADGISKAVDGTNTVKDITLNNKTGEAGKLPLVAAPKSGTEFVTNPGDADPLYKFTQADTPVTVHAYIWMEGCDYDCNSSVVASITGQQVIANLGFAVANGAQA